MSVFCYKWNDADVFWNTVELTWREFCIITDIVSTVGGGPQIRQRLKKLTKDEKQVLINLYIRIQSQDVEFEKRVNKHKNEKVKVTIKDIENFLMEVKNVKVNIFMNKTGNEL